MPIIEFVGIARTGKSTVAKYLEATIPNLTYYPERHDLVPKEVFGDDYKHSEWYAKYCVDQLNNTLTKPGIHLFERGVIDRIVIGNVFYKIGLFTEQQHKIYSSILTPYISKIDNVYVFLIKPELSVQRAKALGKDVSHAIPYMNSLYKEYKILANWFPNAIYLPEKASLEGLKETMLKLVSSAN